jgi:hypothetical protein
MPLSALESRREDPEVDREGRKWKLTCSPESTITTGDMDVDGGTGRQTDRTDRQTKRRDRIDRQDRQTDRIDRQDRQTGQIDRQTDRTDRQRDRQTRQTGHTGQRDR